MPGKNRQRPSRRHRGNRGTVESIIRLPKWAQSILKFCHTLPVEVRTQAIKHLRWIADSLEREWADNPSQSQVPPIPVKDEDQDVKFEILDDSMDSPRQSPSRSPTPQPLRRKRDRTPSPAPSRRWQ